MQKHFLLIKNGIKEHYYCIVDEETFYWVVRGGYIPQSVRKKILDSENLDNDEIDEFNENLHDKNERAMIAPDMFSFYTVSELQKYLTNNDITIVDECETILY